MTEPMRHCANCRKNYPESSLKKEPLDFVRGEDGKPTTAMARYALFCGECESQLGLVDASRDRRIEQFKKKPSTAPAPQPPQQPNV